MHLYCPQVQCTVGYSSFRKELCRTCQPVLTQADLEPNKGNLLPKGGCHIFWFGFHFFLPFSTRFRNFYHLLVPSPEVKDHLLHLSLEQWTAAAALAVAIALAALKPWSTRAALTAAELWQHEREWLLHLSLEHQQQQLRLPVVSLSFQTETNHLTSSFPPHFRNHCHRLFSSKSPPGLYPW